MYFITKGRDLILSVSPPIFPFYFSASLLEAAINFSLSIHRYHHFHSVICCLSLTFNSVCPCHMYNHFHIAFQCLAPRTWNIPANEFYAVNNESFSFASVSSPLHFHRQYFLEQQTSCDSFCSRRCRYYYKIAWSFLQTELPPEIERFILASRFWNTNFMIRIKVTRAVPQPVASRTAHPI